MPGETEVIESFHTLVQASLAVATSSGLLDRDTLARFTPDAQVDGPALALLFAALRARGYPPIIEVPSTDAASPHESVSLSMDTCPPALVPLFTAWSSLVPRIQRLGPSFTKPLSRLTVGLGVPDEKLEGARDEAYALAMALRALSLEIGQRRTFQMRYRQDLQSALDYSSEVAGEPELKSDFRAPPTYSTAPSTSDDNPVMAAIRETLFAALAEVLASSPQLLDRLHSSDAEKPRAFFACLALAVLLVSVTRCDLSPPPRVNCLSFSRSSTFADLPTVIDAEHCPEHLRPLLHGLLGIAALARQAADADDRAAIERAMRDQADAGEATAIERLRDHFLNERSALLLSPDLQRIANAINETALGISAQADFVARQGTVFEILSGLALDERQAW